MLKIRVAPTLLYKKFELVKGVRFDSWRPIGFLIQAIRVYNLREVDELIFLDITATDEGRSPDFEFVDDFADECFMPLTVGGGIKAVDDIRSLLKVGADKVSINTAAVENPDLIRRAAQTVGSSNIVVSIDARKVGEKHEVFTHSGRRATGIDPVSHARRMEALGAGEILLTSIDRDGTMTGYDIELTRSVTDAISIPVVASGGAGNYGDMLSAIRDGHASAVSAASIFHFTHQTPLEAKRFLAEEGIDVRL